MRRTDSRTHRSRSPRDHSAFTLGVGGLLAAVALVAATAVLPSGTAPEPEPTGSISTR